MLVLDAGCGDGRTTELLTNRCDVVGCDFSREALVSLRNQRQLANSPDLVECNLIQLPFEREKFDAISCVHAIGHLKTVERSAVAEELSRVLRPGGHLILEVFGRQDVRFGEGKEFEEATFLRGNGILTHYFSEGEIPDLFPGLDTISEVSDVRRAAFGAVAGKREIRRVLLRKPG